MIVVLTIVWISKDKLGKLSETSVKVSDNQSHQTPIDNKKIITKNEVTKTLNPSQAIPEEVVVELAQQQFSQSLFLEMAIATKQLTDCSRYTHFNFANNLLSIKREQLILDYQVYCKEIKLQYSAVSESKKNRSNELMFMNLAMNSEFSDLIQKGMAFEFFDEEQRFEFLEETINVVINSHNGFIISMLPGIFKSSDSRIYVNNLSNTLGTINQQYTMDIAEQAITLLSCQYNQGLSCKATSSFMLKQCLDDDKACGLDVETWFESNHTDAHNRDIKILKTYFLGVN